MKHKQQNEALTDNTGLHLRNWCLQSMFLCGECGEDLHGTKMEKIFMVISSSSLLFALFVHFH